MKFEIVTIFPDFFRGPLDYGIVRRAREAEFIEILIHDLRAFTTTGTRRWMTVLLAVVKAWC